MANQTQKIYDIIIIGAGAAGLTSAIYTSRRMLSTLIISKDVGGQASTTREIENYPGFEMVGGAELMLKFKKQAEKFGSKFVNEEIQSIQNKNDEFFEIVSHQNKYQGKAVILATGLVHRNLNVSGEKELTGKGVAYCATCDAPFYRKKIVAVVGGGNSALDAAELLAKIAKKVYIIHRGSKFTGEQILINEMEERDNIEIMLNSEVLEIIGEKKVEKIKTINNKISEEHFLEVDGIFIEIGLTAKTDWLPKSVKLNERNEIIISRDCETSQSGIFAAGDITEITYKQVVISAGEGAKAGLQAYNYIRQKIGAKPLADWGKKNAQRFKNKK